MFGGGNCTHVGGDSLTSFGGCHAWASANRRALSQSAADQYGPTTRGASGPTTVAKYQARRTGPRRGARTVWVSFPSVPAFGAAEASSPLGVAFAYNTRHRPSHAARGVWSSWGAAPRCDGVSSFTRSARHRGGACKGKAAQGCMRPDVEPSAERQAPDSPVVPVSTRPPIPPEIPVPSRRESAETGRPAASSPAPTPSPEPLRLPRRRSSRAAP
jgi:hypothetical protein